MYKQEKLSEVLSKTPRLMCCVGKVGLKDFTTPDVILWYTAVAVRRSKKKLIYCWESSQH